MQLELPIAGMTCAGCASRVERKLNELEGVRASVNFATERATIEVLDASIAPERLVEAVESAGYGARLPGAERSAAPEPDSSAPLRRRLVVSALLSTPVLLLSTLSGLQFEGWEWVALGLATPVVFWGGLPLPPRHVDEPASPRGDDGHADQRRHPGRLAVVGLRARPR